MYSTRQGGANGSAAEPMPGPLFVRAAHLGRKRRFAEASDLIRRAKAADQCTLAAALDLQAKLYAQQGLYLEADSCWREAQKADPGNLAYDEALARLRKRRSGLPRLMRAGAFAGALALLFALVWSLVQLSGAIRESEGRTHQDLLALVGSLNELRSTSASQSQGISAAVTQVTSDLHGQATRLQETSEQVAKIEELVRQLPTSVAAKEHRDAVIRDVLKAVTTSRETTVADLRSHSAETSKATRERVAQGFAALEPAIAAQVSKLQERVGAVDAASQKRSGDLATSVAELGRSIAAIERSVNDRVSKAEKMLQADVKSLATGQSVQQLATSLAEVGTSMAALTKTVEELKKKLDVEGTPLN